ncbi:MAG: hypothetical protein WC313_04505, partial [Candidatus Kapaibacterium sp.]
ILFIIGLIVSIVSLGKYIFAAMAFYIIGSIIRHLITFIRESKEPEDELDESEESEPTPF